MNSAIKKPTWKRLGLGLLQHIISLGAFLMVAAILFNSYLSVGSMEGRKTYYLDPLSAPEEFENSAVFQDIFQTAISDITRLVVIKGQLETDGRFDAHKRIDITAFANRKGNGNGCKATAIYELDDLIKWGKAGIEYTDRAMSMTDFVNYYGNYCIPENFALDELGQLYFVGFLQKGVTEEGVDQTAIELAQKEKDDLSDNENVQSSEERERVLEAMKNCSEKQLEDMMFSYIMPRGNEKITASREDDGSLTVHTQMISNRYYPVENTTALYTYADNWIEYIQLQQNLEETIVSLTENYRLYNNCNALYEAEKTNFKYAVSMMTTEGFRSYTNIPQIQEYNEGEMTDYFSEYRIYLIYYPDGLEFIGNSGLTEADIYALMSEYEYAFPETTHIWIGVDTDYSIEGDAFQHAHKIYNKIVPHIRMILFLLGLLSVIWIGICIYLTVTAGVASDEKGNRVLYVNKFDHIWVEFMILFFLGFCFAGYLGIKELQLLTNSVYEGYMQLTGNVGTDMLYGYGCYAAYGFAASLVFTTFWYSCTRRMKNETMWTDSFCYWLASGVFRTGSFIIHNPNSVISTLLPYCMFLLSNVICILVLARPMEEKIGVFRVVLGLVLTVFDGIVGYILFRNNAEHVKIVEGIRRIRNGEVEYQVEAKKLHGENKEIADAVNNIGEGIRIAVRTSMRDEQMKSDLITNVSHDIKTPLTSIINYVDLLKRQDIQEEPARTYIEVLQGKSLRLKQLTDDLVEASKISSGNIELNMEVINLTELVNQAIGEFSEKLEECNLSVVFENHRMPANIYADSRRMWRIVENLFNNICKYALEGTRVYVDLAVKEQMVSLSIKNISKRQMNIQPEELTERFIRGDSARTTEGSGLGLSIAKSLTQVQGGEFGIFLDGDLFKIVLTFKEYILQDNQENEASQGEEE